MTAAITPAIHHPAPAAHLGKPVAAGVFSAVVARAARGQAEDEAASGKVVVKAAAVVPGPDEANAASVPDAAVVAAPVKRVAGHHEVAGERPAAPAKHKAEAAAAVAAAVVAVAVPAAPVSDDKSVVGAAAKAVAAIAAPKGVGAAAPAGLTADTIDANGPSGTDDAADAAPEAGVRSGPDSHLVADAALPAAPAPAVTAPVAAAPAPSAPAGQAAAVTGPVDIAGAAQPIAARAPAVPAGNVGAAPAKAMDAVAAAVASAAPAAAPNVSAPVAAPTAVSPAGLVVSHLAGAGALPAVTPAAAAAAPVAAPANDAAQNNAAALAASVTAMVRDGTSSVTVRLDPPDLGQLSIHVAVGQDSKVNVLLIAAVPQTAQAFSAGADDLRQAFAGAGLSLGQLNVGGGGAGSQQSRQSPRDHVFDGASGQLASGNSNSQPLGVRAIA